MRAAWVSLLLLVSPLGAAQAEPPRSPDVVSGAWVEDRGGQPTLVVGLYRREGSPGPTVAFVGCAAGGAEEPGGYGVIPKDGWTEVALEAGVLLRAERPLRAAEINHPPAVLVAPAAAKVPLDVRTLVNGDVPPDALLFALPRHASQITVTRHVVEIGETLDLELAAPPAEFFVAETLEIARVARRVGIDRDDPDGTSGCARLVWLPGEGDPPAARELSGPEGERRIRAHFTDPKCLWAERHVGWMEPLWLLEYTRATALRFRLETDTVKRSGRLSDIWKGYGALAIEGIYPNGFGGSSSNLDLPPVLILPKGTQTRTAPLR